MTIVFIAPRYHTNQHYWVKALQDAGHTVSFWVRKRTRIEEHERLKPVLIAPEASSSDTPKKEKKWNVAAFRELIATEKPDAFVIRNPTESFARAARKPVREAGVPVVLYSQGPLYRRQTQIHRLATALLQRRMAPRRSRFGTADTHARAAPWITPVRGDYKPGLRVASNWYHIAFVMEPDPVAVSQMNTRQWCPGGVCRVLMVAKYMARKNHLLLVRALHELSLHYPVSLEIVGSAGRPDHNAVRDRVVEYITTHNLDWVTLTPAMPYAKLQEKMRDFDLFVLPSRNEAVGVSLLEAMGKGLPVVCSTTTGARDYVEHGGNGRIFESDSLTDLRDQLHELLADPSTLPPLGRRSLELVQTVHSPQAFLDRFLPLLRP